MKKLLIVQKDEAYFLLETLQVIEKNPLAFKEFQLTILVDEKSMRTVYSNVTPFLKGMTTDESSVLKDHFNLSVNLSLSEAAWDLQGQVQADRKIGIRREKGDTIVDDLWSSYLLTLKARAPYLTFHLQDIYKNILGIKNFQNSDRTQVNPKLIAYGTSAIHMFPVQEQENFLNELSVSYPGIPVKDISEIDLVDDVSATLYVGPATLEALKLTEAGARGIFLTYAFQGFNLIPHEGSHLILSSRGGVFRAGALLKFIDNDLRERTNDDCPYSVYSIDMTTFHGSYLKSHNKSDDTYPFYQAHIVLWNFLLNLADVDLVITKCNEGQLQLLKTHYEVLSKFIRLHDYAMASIDAVHAQARSITSDGQTIDGHLKNLQDIEKISDTIASSHPLLRPFLDFYRIRRGQNAGSTLLEQAQSSLLTYSEEHQALKALQELFSVTLRKNEVNI